MSQNCRRPQPAKTADVDWPCPVYYLPAECITSLGYAAMALCDYDFTPDFHMFPAAPTSGVFKAYGPKSMKGRKPDEWGILSARACGASRIMDWIETQSCIDAKHVD